MTTTRSEIVDELGCTEDELQNAAETVDAIKRAEQRRRQMIEFPHSTTVDGQRVHLFQDVREELEANPFTDGETVVWTVCAIDEDEGKLLLKKAHANWQSRWVSFEEFSEGAYEPIFLESEDDEVRDSRSESASDVAQVSNKVPKFGY